MTKIVTINGEITIAPEGALAWKYGDATEEAKWIYDAGELAEIEREDPSLIERTKSAAAVELGGRGGKSTSEAKQAAARQNGARGGRPKWDCWDALAQVRYPHHEIFDDGECMHCHAWFVWGEDGEIDETKSYASEDERNAAYH